MKIYALTRVDGGVEVMRLYAPAATVESEIARWHPDLRAKVTGEYREIHERELPTNRSQRFAWKPDFSIDAEKVTAAAITPQLQALKIK